MTPDQRGHVAEAFQRLASMAVDDRARELEALRDRDPLVAGEVERLLNADSGRPGETEPIAVSEQLRAEFSPAKGGSDPTVSHRPAPPRKAMAEHVGPYRVIREIGHGGLGYVLLAVREDDRFHKRVAVKLVKKGMDTDEILRRFEQERQVLSALNHPNIARVFDAGTTEDGRPYFVMEYVDGIPIDAYCDSQGLSTEERLKLFRKVCVAVHYAHQNLIVHRDIKPSNIMVTADGEPKLLDFGIAKLLNPDLLFSPVTTGPELRLMTPEYASPEQVEGLPITTASDVYSLGVLLYTLLTGHPPYRLRSRVREEIVRVVCNVDPERPSTSITKAVEVETPEGTTRTLTPEEVARNRDGHVSKLRRRLAGDIDNIVLMAMRKKPPRRYKSAEQFAEDIDRHLGGMPVIARPETWSYIARKFIGRNRFGIAAVLLVFASLTGGLGVAVWQWSEAQLRYRQVLGLARTHIDLQNEIGDRVGSSTAQRVLIEAALPALDGLASVAKPDAALHDLLARGYAALGGIARDSRDAGSLERSVQAFASALQERRTLAAARPGNADLRAEVGLALVNLAQAQAELKRDEAGATLREALAISAALSREAPNGLGSQRLRAAVKLQEGRQLALTSDGQGLDDARRAFEDSIAAFKGLVGDRAVDARWARCGLAWALMELGSLAEKRSMAAEAESLYRETQDVLGAGSTAGESAEVQRMMVAVSGKLGHLLLNQSFEGRDRLDEAMREFSRAGEIAVRLATEDPQSESSARLLRVFYESRGDEIFMRGYALASQGKSEQARVLYRQALDFLRPFLQQSESALRADPGLSGRKRALAVACEKTADVHRQLDEAGDAERLYRRAVDLYQSANGAESAERLRKRAGICLVSVASLCAESKRVDEAIDVYRQAIAELEAGLADAESRDYTKWFLSIAARNLGDLLIIKGDAAAAVPVLVKARDTMADGEAERHNVYSLLGRAHAGLKPPDLVNARTCLERAAAEYASLKSPGDRDHAIMMEASLALGRVHLQAGDAERAKAAWREGLAAHARITKPGAEVEGLRAQLAGLLEGSPDR